MINQGLESQFIILKSQVPVKAYQDRGLAFLVCCQSLKTKQGSTQVFPIREITEGDTNAVDIILNVDPLLRMLLMYREIPTKYYL